MAEYIEKQAAIKELCETYEHEYPTASGAFDEYATRIVPNVLRNLPSADVWPVLRCRDCFANGSCIVQDALFDNDLDKAADFYCAFGREGKDG